MKCSNNRFIQVGPKDLEKIISIIDSKIPDNQWLESYGLYLSWEDFLIYANNTIIEEFCVKKSLEDKKGREYQIQEGDTLWSIAEKYSKGNFWKIILKENPHIEKDNIHGLVFKPGDFIYLPPSWVGKGRGEKPEKLTEFPLGKKFINNH